MHEKSQQMVDALKVGDDVATPGIQGVVLMKGRVQDANNTSYAGVMLLTTVKGQDFYPFRSAPFYYDDDMGSWQSSSGENYRGLTDAVKGFFDRTGEDA